MTKERHLTITLQADWQGALRAAQGQGELPVRALARAGLPCSFASLHIDMHLKAAA